VRPTARTSDDMASHANPATPMSDYHEENRLKDTVEAYINYGD
jgi:hypothetical protein